MNQSEQPSVIHSTFVIERNFPYTPERVFAAFADPDKKRRWFAIGTHHAVDEFTMDFRPGGREVMRSHFLEGSPFPGVSLVNEAIYEDIVANRRVVTAAVMSLGDRRISVSLVTAELLPNGNGCDLVLTHQGAFFEGSGGPKMREEGWHTIIDHLGKELAAGR